jgi:hypothetical protein
MRADKEYVNCTDFDAWKEQKLEELDLWRHGDCNALTKQHVMQHTINGTMLVTSVS